MPLIESPYCGPAPLPADLWSQWNFDPWLVAALLLMGAHYAFIHRGSRRNSLFFISGWLLLVILFISPLCALSSALFSVRVAHHVLLLAFVAPMLALAYRAWLGFENIRPVNLGVAAALQAIMMWIWHAPAPYAAALSSHSVFWIMQVSLLGTAILFWHSLLRSKSPGLTTLALIGTGVQMSFLGALITLSPVPLYQHHFLTATPWGLSSLDDQQIAGLIMWVPAALPYMIIALVQAWSWLGTAPRTTETPSPS